MGILIPLEAIPNQTLNIAPDSHEYELTVRTMQNGYCVISISRDGVAIINSARCTSSYYVLPYAYLESDSGNFVWSMPDGEYPQYKNFGISNLLYFVPLSELEAFRNGTA